MTSKRIDIDLKATKFWSW